MHLGPAAPSGGCQTGYIAANGGCQPIVSGDVCAGFAVKDQTGTLVGAGRSGFTVGDRLQVILDSAKASTSLYQFELVPKQGKVTGNAADPVPLDQPGSFSLDLAYTPPDGPSVRCPSLLQTVDVVASRSCDKLQATFVLGSSSARGATSSLRASVSLPAGLNATVIASPPGQLRPCPSFSIGRKEFELGRPCYAALHRPVGNRRVCGPGTVHLTVTSAKCIVHARV